MWEVGQELEGGPASTVAHVHRRRRIGRHGLTHSITLEVSTNSVFLHAGIICMDQISMARCR